MIDVWFCCQVMGESYDSLGSRVVRHFRHYIDGKNHVWLRGNFCDEDSRLCQTAKHPALKEEFAAKSVITDSFTSAVASTTQCSKSQNNNVADDTIQRGSTSQKRKRPCADNEEDGLPSKISATTYLHVSPDELDK